MITMNEELLKKITGDVPDEAGEAIYRVGANRLVEAVEVKVIDKLEADNVLRTLLNKDRRVGEAVISFAIAAALELFPTSKLGDMRQRLAYNLRVQAYERIGELLLRIIPFIREIEDEAAIAILSAKGLNDMVDRALGLDKEKQKPKYAPFGAARARDGKTRSTSEVPRGSEGPALEPVGS